VTALEVAAEATTSNRRGTRRLAASRAASARREAANRTKVFQVMEAVRASGVSKSEAEFIAETGLSKTTITKHARAYLQGIIAELLGAEVRDDEAFSAWMTLYRTFASRIWHFREGSAVHARFLRLNIDTLDRTSQPVTLSAIRKMSGAAMQLVVAALRAWEAETGRKRAQGRARLPVTLAMVLPLIDPALHRVPFTFLDDPRTHRSMDMATLRLISSLDSPKLRNTAFLCLAIAPATSRNDNRFFGMWSEFLPALGLADIDAVEPDAFYPAFHDGCILPELTPSIRARWLQSYFRLLSEQEMYFERLTPEQASALAPFRLHAVKSAAFWRRSRLPRQLTAESRGRRKAATAAVHDKFYFFRNIAERRLNQLVRLRQAFRDACGRVRSNPGTTFPVSFAYSEEVVMPAGSARTVTHRYRLWDGHALRRAHEPVAPKRYYAYKENYQGFAIRPDALFLSYEGASAERETAEQAEFWFADLLRAGGFSYDPDLAPLAALGYKSAKSIYPPARPDWPFSTARWLKRVAADLGLLFLPVETLLASGLVGQASLQTMTKTGARVGEVLQIRLTREHLTRVELPGGKEAIAFRAIPKGRETEEPFYIDLRCLKALQAWFTFFREHEGRAVVLRPHFTLRTKCEPAPYLFQFGGRHFDPQNINACMRFLLHGVQVLTARGEVVRLSAHLLRHGFATELRGLGVPIDVIALLLNQRDVDVTRYYAQPTPAQLVELQERIFVDRIDLTRTHLRAPAEIRRQVEEARGGVGALVPVVGGTCTVANMCPAKFACVGCAGNAPDPHKREQVEQFKRIWEDMVRLASEQGLLTEERKARGVVAGSEDMLAEMDLIEAAERDGMRLAEIRFAQPSPSGKQHGTR